MIGQSHVTDPLMTALRTGRVGHAYLFSGPRGCGKTTSARILARSLNCAEGPTDTPCGTCPSCIELSREGGGSLDVVEIDAASHGGVDDARDLRERAVFAPARDRYKIFIIDEAHMVTSGGFNALLKIVEEPPPHVKFIFATTEPEKVIGTIRSRTHHYPFRLIAPGALIDYTQQMVDSEQVSVESGVLPLVVRAGGGSVRDTLSILDQLIAGSENGQVTLERATGLLGYTSTELIDETVMAFAAGDAAAAFAAVDRVIQTGQDPRRFVEDVLERLRDLIVIAATNVDGAAAVFRGISDDQLQRMFEQSQRFNAAELSRIADTVAAGLEQMAGATAPRLQLELMVARALRHTGSSAGAPAATASTAANPPAQSQQASSQPQQAASPAPAASAPATATAARSTPAAPAPDAAPAAAAAQPATPAVNVLDALKSAREFLGTDTASKPPMVPLGGQPPKPTEQPQQSSDFTGTDPSFTSPIEPLAAAAHNANPAFAELQELWPSLLEELRETNAEAYAAVQHVQPLAFEGDLLTVGLTSKQELNAFKVAGAAPLREVIDAAIGINVKYLPKPITATQQPTAEPEQIAEPTPAAESAPEPEPEHAPEPAPVAAPELEPEPQPEVEPAPVAAPEASAAAPQSTTPPVQRYGEAVVREVLGARFVEERPLPESFTP